jgi:HSP20 family molecular chaperone IbpA
MYRYYQHRFDDLMPHLYWDRPTSYSREFSQCDRYRNPKIAQNVFDILFNGSRASAWSTFTDGRSIAYEPGFSPRDARDNAPKDHQDCALETSEKVETQLSGSGASLYPVNVSVDDECYEVWVSVPGYDKSRLDVTVKDKLLTVTGTASLPSAVVPDKDERNTGDNHLRCAAESYHDDSDSDDHDDDENVTDSSGKQKLQDKCEPAPSIENVVVAEKVSDADSNSSEDETNYLKKAEPDYQVPKECDNQQHCTQDSLLGKTDLTTSDSLLANRPENKVEDEKLESGTETKSKKQALITQIPNSSFVRQLRFGSAVDAKKCQCSLNNGILYIRLPKLGEQGEIRIPL